MKKVIKMMMMLVVASGFVLSSCSDDEETKDVELTIIPSSSTAGGNLFVFDTIRVTVNGVGNSDNKLKNFKVTKAKVGSATQTLVDAKLSGTSYILNFGDTLVESDTGTITYTFTLTGDKGNVQTKTFVATVTNIGVIDVSPTTIQLFAQSSGQEVFMTLTPPFTQYTLGDALANDTAAIKEDVDLGSYYSSGTSSMSIASLFHAPYQTQIWSLFTSLRTRGLVRKTEFVRVSGVDFQKIADSEVDRDLQILARGKTWVEAINNLAVNDIVLYRTKDGKLGLIKIEDVSGLSGTPSQSGTFTINILAQAE